MDSVGRVWNNHGAEFVCARGCAAEELPRTRRGRRKVDSGEAGSFIQCAANWALVGSLCALCVDGLAVFGGLGTRNV